MQEVVMRRELPAHPSLEHLKSQAKDLLDAYQRRDPEALRRIREALPAAHGAEDSRLAAMKLALHDAQSVIAREHGAESWNELRALVEARTKATPSPSMLRALMERHMTTPMPQEVLATLRALSAPTGPARQIARAITLSATL